MDVEAAEALSGGVLRHNLPGPINARRRERCSVLGSEPDCPCRCESPICVRHTFMACLRMLGDRDRPSIPCINTRGFELHRFLSEAECRPRMRNAHNPLWTSGLIRIWPSPSKISCSLWNTRIQFVLFIMSYCIISSTYTGQGHYQGSQLDIPMTRRDYYVVYAVSRSRTRFSVCFSTQALSASQIPARPSVNAEPVPPS